MNESQQILIKRSVALLTAFICLYCVYVVVTAVTTQQNTGILRIKSTSPEASLVVTRANRQAASVGTGDASARLRPGSYQVSASVDGRQASKTVVISKGKTSTVSLNPIEPTQLPSPSTIIFQGTDSLIENGLSASQISNLEQAFFDFKPSTQVVTVDTDTIYPEARNPADPRFKISFDVTVDSTTYRALISYTDLINVNLLLYNKASGALLFDSANQASVEGE